MHDECVNHSAGKSTVPKPLCFGGFSSTQMGITCITGINPLQRAPVCAGYKITVIPLEGPVGVDGECSEHTQSRQRRGRKGSQLEKEGAVQC